MIRKFTIFIVLSLSACSTYTKVTINSAPTDAKFTIKNAYGSTVYSGSTPSTVDLDSDDGDNFTQAEYIIKYEKPGYKTKTEVIRSFRKNWAFFALIDMPMYNKFEESIYASLDKENASNNGKLN